MFLQITMSYTSLNNVDRQNSHQKSVEIVKQKQKTYNHYEPDKTSNTVPKTKLATSLKRLDLNDKDIENVDDDEIYYEIANDQVFEESTLSTPTSLYEYINFENNLPFEQISDYYHYPIFKLKSLHLDDNCSISEKSYLDLHDVSLLKTTSFQVAKDQFLTMSLFEKRQFYKCGYNFVTLEEIPTWSSSSTEAFQTKKAPSNSNWLKLVNEKVSLYTGNIIALEIDAIVNSTNTKLRNRKNGIDGYIHTAAGKKYLEAECQSLGGCERGKCKITGGYLLPAKYIIHCVGPIGENDAVLSSCYESALDTLKVNNLRSIAFPAISTGQYGYSAEKAVPVVLKAIRRWLEKPVNLASVDRIIVVRYLDQDTALFKQHMPKYFSQ